MKEPAITAVVNQSRPESRGSIHVKSTNIADAPAISANYLSSPLDQDTLLKGMRILLEVFQQSDLQPYLKQRLSPENVDVNMMTTL